MQPTQQSQRQAFLHRLTRETVPHLRIGKLSSAIRLTQLITSSALTLASVWVSVQATIQRMSPSKPSAGTTTSKKKYVEAAKMSKVDRRRTYVGSRGNA